MSYKALTRNGAAVVVATILMLSTTAAHAKCRFQVDMPDFRTGEHVRWTNWTTFTLVMSGHTYVVTAGISEGDRKYVGLRVRTQSSVPRRATKEDLDNAVVVPVGSEIFFRMADDSIVKVATDEVFTGDSVYSMRNANHYDIATEAIIKAPLTAAEISALTAQRVKQIRVTTTAGNLDFDFGKKGSKKMQEVLECVQ